MRFIFIIIGFLPYISFSQSDWIWAGAFPWLWDNDSKGWWYVHADNNGKFYTYRHSESLWYSYDDQISTWQIVEGQDEDLGEGNERLKIDPEEYQAFSDSINDIIKYIEQVRASGSNVVSLQLGFMNLNDPSVSGGYKMLDGYIFDLSPFEAALKGVTKLQVINHRLQDISPLSTFTQLKDLSLRENDISDLTPLSNLFNLEVLDIHWNLVNDIKPLSNLSLLTKLDLSGNEIENINPISNLLNLKSLDISDNKIHSLEPLKSLKNLEALDIGENNLSDLSPLKELSKLQNLNCEFKDKSGRLLDFTPLASLPKLERINLSYYSDRDGYTHSPSEEQLETIGKILPHVQVTAQFYYSIIF